jgi:hypothetical protein
MKEHFGTIMSVVKFTTLLLSEIGKIVSLTTIKRLLEEQSLTNTIVLK